MLLDLHSFPTRRSSDLVEDVALVSAAADAVVLDPLHEELAVGLGAEAAGDEVVEARPPGAALVLGLGLEERQRAAGAYIRARALLAVERARARTLGAFLAQHRERLGREALPPFFVGEVPLLVVTGGSGLRGAVQREEPPQGGGGCEEFASDHGG